MADGVRGACWADVAVAHQRTVRSFEEHVQPVLDAMRVPRLGVANVLFLLAVGRDGKRVCDVVREERLVGSNASYALDVLAKAGLVDRHRDPRDRRKKLVAATAKGRRLIDEVCRISRGDASEVGEALRAVARFEARVAVRAAPPDGSDAAREPAFIAAPPVVMAAGATN